MPVYAPYVLIFVVVLIPVLVVCSAVSLCLRLYDEPKPAFKFAADLASGFMGSFGSVTLTVEFGLSTVVTGSQVVVLVASRPLVVLLVLAPACYHLLYTVLAG